jgi:steroid delta-isomerase-like uncharacterized protein
VSAANESALDLYAEAKNRHDVDAILELCHPDCAYRSVGLPGEVRGTDQLRAFYTALFGALPDYRGDFDGRAFTGETAAVWGRFGGTLEGELQGLPASGQRIEVPVVFMVTFKDGLIVEDVGYFDVRTLAEQAGAPPVHAAALARAADWVRRFEEAWADPTPDRLADLVHPHTSNVYPFMDEAVDRDGLIEFFRLTFAAMPDLRLEVLRWGAQEDYVLVEWSATATIGGEQRTWQGADRFTLEGDKGIEGRAYYDSHPVREAMAAARAPAAA